MFACKPLDVLFQLEFRFVQWWNMNVQTKTEPVHTVCTPTCLSPFFFVFLTKHLFLVFHPRCLFRVSKMTRGAFFSKHALYCLGYFLLFEICFLPRGEIFLHWSQYACFFFFFFCVQSGQTCPLFRFLIKPGQSWYVVLFFLIKCFSSK